jgi:hypothetical protein
LSVLLATASCGEGGTITKTEARATANKIINNDYNIKNLSALKLIVHESKSEWTFVYEPVDENSLGGPFSVTVSKNDGKVLGQSGNQ